MSGFICLMLALAAGQGTADASGSGLILTTAEQNWLAAHTGKVRLAPAPDWEPMEFFDEVGEYRGLVADYIRLIEQRLGFTFRIIRTGSWSETLVKARNREIDVISAAQPTADRRQFMTWSRPYVTVKTTIIVRKERKQNFTLDRMAGMRIGVPREYAVGYLVREAYPELDIKRVNSNRDGLYKVSFGELDAMITEVPNALYVIENEKITNLRLAGDTGFELRQGIGVRNDWPILAGMIEKALADISEAEHQAIHARWIRLDTDRFYETRIFWYGVLGVFACVLAVVGTVMAWNQTLKKQVRQRTEAVRFNEMRLEALLQLNERSHDSIREMIEFAFLQMIRLTKSRSGYLAFDDQDGLIYSVRSGSGSGGRDLATKITPGFSIETRGLWGEAVRRGQAVISNDYPMSNPMKKGLPREFQGLVRYMNVPVAREGRVVMVAGVGNKACDYDASDLRQLTLLVRGLWRRLRRKQVEETLAGNEKNLRDIVENSPNGITIIQNGEVVYRNARQVKLAGDIILGKKIEYGHIKSGDREAVREFYQGVLRGRPDTMELDYRFYTSLSNRTQDTLKCVTCLITPINYRDENAFLMTTIDRTRARELEHLLTVQDKMASLGRVAAGIGHEIRNPLSGINIYLRAIEKGVENPDKAHKILPAIDAIRTASGKMEAVVKRVIDFSKPIEPRFARIDINVPAREAVALAGMGIKKKHISLVIDPAPDLPSCQAEPNLIEEVVVNLVNNAVDAMAGQANEKIIRVATFAGTGSGRHSVFLSVEDSGPGVPEALREKIFDPFFTTKEYSTGIGLSLCHRIITDHNGRIRVDRGRAGGARFTLELPVADTAPPPTGTHTRKQP
ncbi:MAG: transporter substrate-binding domain-containing protein [Desulfobacter sp.]